MPKRPQYAPHNWTVHAYGQRIQYDPLPDATPPAISAEITRAQAMVGALLYNARRRSNTFCALTRSGLTIVHRHNNNNQCSLTSP
jgi:hypothetical protein